MRLLVIGDIMLDRYIRGKVERISPEAPVPVLNIESTEHTLGGCGNVARNLVTMGADVTCWAAAGVGRDGRQLMRLVDTSSITNKISESPTHTTTVKTRMVDSGSGQQLLRCDKESSYTVPGYRPQGDFDVVIISDYGKGFITDDTADVARSYDVPVIVDPHPQNARLYNHMYAMTPNAKEFSEMRGWAGVGLVFETRGEGGIILHSSGHADNFPAVKAPVYDVQGAGDTVVAAIAYCKALGMSPQDSARVAVKSAGYVVSRPGTSVVPKDVFDSILEEV